MFKKDPLSPFNAYCRRYVVTGMGMFTEGYTICKYHARSCAPFPLCAGDFLSCASRASGEVMN